MNYAAEMDRIVADYQAASRTVLTHFLDADARTTRSGAEVFDEVRQELIQREQQHEQSPEHRAADEALAEHDRLLREATDRARAAAAARKNSRDNYVMPTDWTDEDEAREEGYDTPKSWLV
ncbi:hypothetical protein [Nocardia anaemiae]|uniref:hypothetical protein n=1 Tax=Nocardia anaemiae TaxID=263910 RepID=UPI0007A3F69E|nr:hypothetical protein [Nocardia anaemiae]